MVRSKSTPKQKSTDRFCENDISGYIPVLKKKKRLSHATKLASCKTSGPTDKNKSLILGELEIGPTNNCFNNECPQEWNVTINKNQNSIVLEQTEHTVIVSKANDIDLIEDVVTSKLFAIEFKQKDETVTASIYIKTLPLPKHNRKIGSCFKQLFKIFYNISHEDCKGNTDELAGDPIDCGDLNKIYDSIRESRAINVNDSINVQHPKLKPKLREYQVDAVKWMLSRETIDNNDSDELHPLFTAIELPSGTTLYYDKYSGFVQDDKPKITPSSKGGILADEMGLGKTVEVIACMLCNPMEKPPESDDTPSPSKPTVDHIIQANHEKKKRLAPLQKAARKDAASTSKPEPETPPKKKISLTRVALEKYYAHVLFGNRKEEKKEPSIQCICSEQNEDGKIECGNCGKFQHRLCTGYEDHFGTFKCSQCWMEEEIFDVGGTLIVTPKSLKKQWINEMMKHVDGKFNILVYDDARDTTIYPVKLKEYDVVITTYNVLQNEIYLTNNNLDKNFRRKRVYSPRGCPLIRVKWWRLCLDEAQTVDAPKSMISSMSRMLEANYRWAVTGTPLSKNISDIYGLINYLHITPFNDEDTWTNILYNPFKKGDSQPMCNFLSKVMWRTEKRNVLNQINIPPQHTKEYVLEFSAVEKFYYNKEHEMSRDLFFTSLEGFDVDATLKSLQKRDLNKIMAPFLSLRQACSHPNATRGKYLATRKNISSVKGLLDALIEKNGTECEEMLRTIVASLNGMAGICILYGDMNQAVDKYRQVLQLSARFSKEENGLQVDTLQMIHAMHNLSEVLPTVTNVEPTLHDSTLKTDCAKLEQKYIEKFNGESKACFLKWQEIYMKIEQLETKFALRPGQWYSDGIHYLTSVDYYDKLIGKIQSTCDNAMIKCTLKYEGGDLLYILSSWDEAVRNLRTQLVAAIETLYRADGTDGEDVKIVIDQLLISQAMNCHLRPQKKGKQRKCGVCDANRHFVKYESKLFSAVGRTMKSEEFLETNKGTWVPTMEEAIIKSLQPSLKSKNASNLIVADGENHLNLLELLKEEFKAMRKFWTALYQQINAQDELDICKIRMALKEEESENEEDEEVKKMKRKKNATLKKLDYDIEDKTKSFNQLSPHEMAYHESKLRMEEQDATVKLEKNLGTKKYLETLKKQQYEGQSPDPCPICKNPLTVHWSILSCGHSYCIECIQLLLGNVQRKSFQCSICRKKLNLTDISYIKADGNDAQQDAVTIRGNFSTKIEAVVKLLLDIKKETPEVKVLLFSTWVPVLRSLKEAFDVNFISNEIICDSYKFEQKIDHFKTKFCTVLLMPLSLGSKGLNIIEATHVVLIEPVLNPADELQAIGRVHRIGQTKETYIHKFYIKDTIEKKLFEATSTHSDNWESNKVTIKQLTDLFICDDE